MDIVNVLLFVLAMVVSYIISGVVKDRYNMFWAMLVGFWLSFTLTSIALVI
jgi:predicted benzoate:H+ symporter BenE